MLYTSACGLTEAVTSLESRRDDSIYTTAVFDQKTHFQLHKTALPKYEEDSIYFTLSQYFRYQVWVEAHERKVNFGRLLETKKMMKF